MLKRTIYIGTPSYLKVKLNQMQIIEPKTKVVKGSVPIEDMALLMLDHHQITISTQLIDQLMQHTVAVIHCDGFHLPNGMMLPIVGHTELTQRWRVQLEASIPLKKQLWKQTVIAKIRNQRNLLEQYGKYTEPMTEYLSKVSSGDEQNMEGKAANHYWKYFLDDFKRDRFGDAPNQYLNFGYAVLRSIVARAIVSSGMLPAQGIFHKNKYNPYCLADDIMEPYRPFVDALVLEYLSENEVEEELNVRAKAKLLQIATQDVRIDGNQRPLMVAVTTTTSSVFKCFSGERRIILYPELS